jgi:tRNA/tmRNA/rRNA uracil-C5-methylase (TrmA/RlmC/RlmD family)
MEICSHRPPCPGCPRFGEAGVGGAAHATLERLAADTGAELWPARVGEPFGHRHRARLMVRGRSRSPKVGLFQAGTHRIVDTPRCRVHHPVINGAVAALKRAMRSTGAEPYADAPHRGLVRALQVAVERPSQRAQVVLVANEGVPTASPALLDALARELERDGLLHSLWWNGNSERTNVILGDAWLRRCGPDALEENIGGVRVFFPPGAFGQSHLPMADRIVADVHELVREGERVTEWYAGCGAIGLGLLARGHAVAFNEQSPDALAGLRLGIDVLGSEARERSGIASGSAGDHAALANECDFAIADPPRRGLDPELLRALATKPIARLAYLSCGVESLDRDARALVGAGRLELRRLVPYALFPFTEHVETLALFEGRD